MYIEMSISLVYSHAAQVQRLYVPKARRVIQSEVICIAHRDYASLNPPSFRKMVGRNPFAAPEALEEPPIHDHRTEHTCPA